MMEYNFIDTQITNRIGFLTFARSESLNAFNLSMLKEFGTAIKEFSENPEVSVIIIKGSNKAFAAGIDIQELSQVIVEDCFDLSEYNYYFSQIEKCKKPIITIVSGYALGVGFEIAMASDIVFAAENAKFGMPEISFASTPMFGGISKLLMTIGKAQTSEIILTGKAIDAFDAQQVGLISRIVPLANLESEAIKVAQKMIATSPKALLLAKESIKNAQKELLGNSIDFENKNTSITLNDKDLKEHLLNFINKNK